MRIPPFHKRPNWQRFLAGVLIGILVGWSVFVFQFGNIHERTVVELRKNELKVAQLEDQIELLLAREEEQNEDEETLTIEGIEITFENERESRLSELTLFDLRQQAIDELEPLLHQELSNVASNQELVIRTIENKRFSVNDHEYMLVVNRAIFYSTLAIHADIVTVSD
ncbi:hypothetical protein JCM19037_1196 [Geomicrobium sp. JCM 19037]|nr:sporulation membrane protein YtrI [Geomicrobium sp. JCM 19037]GAK02926.1 hypothetical protein JCM19037_1196 [Geomicrobium sp. JCM 19037]